MAELRADENGQKRTALQLMRKHDRTSWRHAGVELARVPGEEKLRVRKSKESATAEVEEDLPSDATAPAAEAAPDEQQQLPGSEDADDQGINTEGVH
jgi:hypothetical protein